MKTTISLGREIKISLLLFLFIIGNTTILISQEELCLTIPASTSSETPYSYSTDPSVIASHPPHVFNIKFWGIDKADGSNDNHLTEEKALASVAKLNIEFNQMGIYFKYRGFDRFNSPTEVPIVEYNQDSIPNCYNTGLLNPDGYNKLYKCEINSGRIKSYANSVGAYDPNAINVYVPNSTVGYSAAVQGIGSNRIYIPTHLLDDPRMLHEMGHVFRLEHPFLNYNETNCERVTREETDIEYNAEDAGDEVVDTAAQDELWDDVETGSCLYIGDKSEHCGDPTNPDNDDYIILTNDTHNYMGYGSIQAECADSFTTGQKIKMLEDISWYNGSYGPWKTDICALYEPYKGEYYVNGPAQDPRDKPLFQPGFNYRFVECNFDCDQPNICDTPKDCEDYDFTYTNNSVLTISKYETDYSIITHPNHTAIEIDFVAPLPIVLIPNTRRCYNNWNRAANGGSVIQFNDNVFNNNITITPQDSTSINNPNLIDDLQPGLYKVEKNYDDGAVQETIIIKENEN